jgi:excisionase family DNA binding protein
MRLLFFILGMLMREAVKLDWRPDRPLLLSQEQAALWLNVSPRTIRNLIKKRKLIPKFIGRRCLIPTAAVERFARQVAG